MSLYSSVKAAFTRVGVILRDHNERLKQLEMRTVSLYPIIKFAASNTGQTMPNQEVYRLDGTLAYKLVFIPATAGVTPPAGIAVTNFNNTVAFIEVYIYGTDGTTILDNYTLKMDSDTGATTNTRGLINGSSFY